MPKCVSMYIRTIKRKNKDGSVVEYVQLAHNVRHPEKGYPKAEVIHSFGRREQLDVEGLKRLVASIGRFIEIGDLQGEPIIRPSAPFMTFVRSQSVGVIFMLHALWDRLQINDCLQMAAKPQAFPVSCQQALFEMVAGSILAPFPAGLSISHTALADIFPGQRVSFDDRHFSQAIEMLHTHADALQRKVSRVVISELSLNAVPVFVHLIPASTTNNLFESSIQMDDHYGPQDQHEASNEGIIALALSQSGIPMGCWSMPGQEIDTDFIEIVEMNLNQWSPRRIVWVMGGLLTGDKHQNVLEQSGRAYILGRKLRGSCVTEYTKAPKGRFKILGPDLQIKASITRERDCRRQCVIAYHPEQAAIDRKARKHILERLGLELDRWDDREPPDAATRSRLDRALKRYVKILKGGAPKINSTRVRQDEKNDGKYLLLSNDNRLPPEILAWGHKQQLDIDRTYRDLKPLVVPAAWDVLPDDCTDAGMLLSWLILLLMRVAGVQTGMSWADLCRDMQALHLGEFADGNRRIFKYTELTSRQKKILRQLHIELPQV